MEDKIIDSFLHSEFSSSTTDEHRVGQKKGKLSKILEDFYIDKPTRPYNLHRTIYNKIKKTVKKATSAETSIKYPCEIDEDHRGLENSLIALTQDGTANSILESIIEPGKRGSQFKSHKKRFFKHVYSNSVISDIYMCVIEILFELKDPEGLSECLYIKCCNELLHDEITCKAKWNNLKVYLSKVFLQDLKVRNT